MSNFPSFDPPSNQNGISDGEFKVTGLEGTGNEEDEERARFESSFPDIGGEASAIEVSERVAVFLCLRERHSDQLGIVLVNASDHPVWSHPLPRSTLRGSHHLFFPTTHFQLHFRPPSSFLPLDPTPRIRLPRHSSVA
jgi:hypothetical protein